MSSSEGWSDAFTEEDVSGDIGESFNSKEMKTKDSIIFLIDCSKDMFTENEQGEIVFDNTVKLVAAAIKDKIISSPNDLIAVILYGSRASANENGFESIFLYEPLSEPSAKTIKKVEKLLDRKDFETTLGNVEGDKVQFYQALWACSGLFADSGVKNSYKRILLFTNNDNPIQNPDLRQKALQKATDLEDLDIVISLFPMPKKGQVFNARKFFMDIIPIETDEATGKVKTDFSSSFEDLSKSMKKKLHKKRALGTIPFQLAPGLAVNVKIYCLIRMARKENAGWVDKRSNEDLTCVTQWLCADTAVFLEDFQMKKYYPYGGESVFFTDDEMKTIKDFGDPGLTLMGFKPISRLKTYHNVKNPYFLYPDDSEMKGSTVAFSALLDQMVSLKKMAIARFNYRKRAIPRFVALVPQDESVDAEGDVVPPGLHLIFLPYADDIRKLSFDPLPIAPPELIEKAKKIVRDLRIKFDKHTFENPVLQKHYATLQALALDEDAPQEVEDLLLPDEEGMEKFKDDILAFKEEYLSGGGEEEDPEPTGKKRKNAPKGSKTETKKKRKAAEDNDEDIDWASLKASGKLAKLTIPKLKIYLRKHGLAVGGKKADLVDRVEQHMARSE